MHNVYVALYVIAVIVWIGATFISAASKQWILGLIALGAACIAAVQLLMLTR